MKLIIYSFRFVHILVCQKLTLDPQDGRASGDIVAFPKNKWSEKWHWLPFGDFSALRRLLRHQLDTQITFDVTRSLFAPDILSERRTSQLQI